MATHPPLVPGLNASAQGRQRYRRNRRGEFAIWWREIDRVLLTLILAVMAIGTAAVAASSPASARRLSTAALKLDDLHFFIIHLRWQAIGLAVMFGASCLPKDMARRIGILLGAAMLVGLALVPVIGSEVNGAKRWLNLGVSLQPSEFLKPAFAIGLAWILSWRSRDPNIPVLGISVGIMALVGGLLMLQPDFGSTILFAGVWFVLVLLSGMSIRLIAGVGAAGVALMVATYVLYDNARHRIDAFLGGGTAYDQVDLAQRTLLSGGWTGSGLWLGTRKLSLPEAHTDYIFSVIGEEFGLWVCAVIVMLYLAIIVRVLLRLVEEEDLFTVLAATGLTAQLGGQAFINILVNLQLFPSKGMTLPLISYGGSSTVALCLGVGFLLAITRRNPFITREGLSLREPGAKK
ncbi:FtsW/RodA/SpoVE family cell cycle protein [Novosphingobium sp. JCM 18896]|uniref:FtsW/RodA/SpoVE family cell cycle protein n=1 Tax=Novosphingobium sp. JCM 18896 TaxID=2989731 RepID=UPI0022213DE6|nr:putative peptidoglycan glycosyltransferase FtsW [Novosphingobium sp. JCM 18896]MCW1430523.1 putative lipid II flippase FtsW [Novosphingobium sp. JCM 18896]